MPAVETDVAKALDYLTTPVAMITVATKDKRNAMTATRITCISAKPTLVAVSIADDRFSHSLIKEAGEFVVNLAAVDQSELAARIGRTSGRDLDKFAEYSISVKSGAKVRSPLIDGCSSNMECKLVNTFEIGDRTLFVGEVVALHVDEDKPPLARFYRKYRKLGEQI